MITLSKENVVDYVKSMLNFFNLNGDIKVSAIGEGSVEEDGDGFINFVYRVSDGEHHLIVKQSTLEARSKGSFTLDLNRYKLEYDAMKICAAIVPDLIPKLYDVMRRIVYLLQKMFLSSNLPLPAFKGCYLSKACRPDCKIYGSNTVLHF